jgi:MFS family permease
MTAAANTPGSATTRAGKTQAYTLIALGTMPALAIAALVPVLPALFQQFKDVPNRELLVPMILTVPSLCVALFSTPLGAVADRWGRRRLLLLALLAFGLFGLAPMLFDDLRAIIASRFVVGLAEGAILTTSNALMGDYFEGEERKRWLGLQMSVGPFVSSGFILAGGALGGISWRGPFLLYMLGLVVLVAVWFTLHEPLAATSRTAGSTPASGRFPWPATFLVGGVTLLVSVIYFVQAVQHGRIFGDLGVSTPARIGTIVTIASMGTVVGGYAYSRTRRRGVGMMLAIVFGCYGASYLGISLAPGYISGALFDSVGQFAGGFGLATLIAWALSKYDYQHRGRGMGVWAACFFLGQFLSPPVLTLIGRGHLSFLASVGVLGAVSLGCALVAALLARSPAGAAPAHQN